MKGLSAGVLVTDGEYLLLGHATGQKHWDLPKGGLERGESPLDAAVRELREETGIVVGSEELVEIGLRGYSKRKDLHLFWLRMDVMPEIHTLRCSSKYRSRGLSCPEFDQFNHVLYAEIHHYCVPNMTRALKAVLGI